MTARLGIRAAFWQTWHAHRLVLSSVVKVEPVFGFFKWHRRKRLRAAPFPADWLEIVEKKSGSLPACPGRPSRAGLIQIFLHEKILEGCGGLVLTDEIKVTIAAQACLLLLHRDTDIYPKLTTVLVYPSAYIAKAVKPVGSGLALEGETVNLGESWTNGIVVLSWDEIRAGASDMQDGRNLVLHEFAHQLDREDGAVDGTPLLDQRSQYAAGPAFSMPNTNGSIAIPGWAAHRARRIRHDRPR